MKISVILFTMLFTLAANVNGQALEDIVWISEDHPPHNFLKNGTPTGLGVDVLVEIWKRVGLNKHPDDILIWPWPRGYKTLQERSDVCLFTMAMTPDRLLSFKFVGPMLKGPIGILAKKSNGFKINSHQELINFYPDLAEMQIGSIRLGYAEQLLLKSGYDEKLLHRSSNPDSLVMMLELDRLSAITLEYTSAMWKMGQLSIDPSKYELIHTFAEIPVGFGFNRKTDPGILAILQSALDELISDGTLEKIYYKYQNNMEQSGLLPSP